MSVQAESSPFVSPPFAVERQLTGKLLSFVLTTGVEPLLARQGAFSEDEALELLRTRLGFVLDDPVRVRMIRVLLDFLADCGYLREEPGGRLSWDPSATPPPGCESGERSSDDPGGLLGFFGRCLDHAPAFLRGQPPLFDFGEACTSAWEGLLGNGDFALARAYLARLVLPRNGASPCQALVLCYGPGFDLVEIERRGPGTVATALDFTGSFFACASARLRHADRVQWVSSAAWGGFGTPLPFDAGTFDAVLFSCADPYVPAAKREAVYRDICRVIRPGGALGILTRSYPDRERIEVSEPWVRRGTFCHDFLESVCLGWQGFRDAASSRRLFRDAGFTIDVVTLNGSVWRLLKQEPGAGQATGRRER